jgi:hypothetical protein
MENDKVMMKLKCYPSMDVKKLGKENNNQKYLFSQWEPPERKTEVPNAAIRR